jgi:hypothetical protein
MIWVQRLIRSDTVGIESFLGMNVKDCVGGNGRGGRDKIWDI